MQSGAFWQEIDGSPVFHLCYYENIAIILDSGIDIVVLLQGGSKFVSGGENSTPTGWLDKPLQQGKMLC